MASAAVLRLSRLAGNSAVASVLDHTASDKTAAPSPPVAENLGQNVSPGPGKAGKVKFQFARQGVHETPIESCTFGGVAGPSPRGRDAHVPSHAPAGKNSAATKSAAGAGRMSDVGLTRQSDSLSPVLINAVDTNEQISTITVDITSGEQAGALQYTLHGAQLSSVSQSGDATRAAENISITFQSWEVNTPANTGVDPSATAGSVTFPALDKKPIGLRSVSWGATSPHDPNSGQATGRNRMQDVTFTKAVDEHTPTVLDAMTQNRKLGAVKFALFGANAESGQAASATNLDIKNARVSSINQSTSEGGMPVEVVSLSYGAVALRTSAAGSPKKALDEAPAVLDASGGRSGHIIAPVHAWSWGSSSPADPTTGQARGRRVNHPFSLQMPAGPHLTKLFNALQNHDTFKSMTITPRSGPSYALGHVQLENIQLAAGGHGEPTASVSLVYQSIVQAAGHNMAADAFGGHEIGGNGPGSPKQSGPTSKGPGVAGDADFTLRGHPVSTPIESFSFGGVTPTDPSSGQAAGKTVMSEVNMVRQSDDQSPRIMQAFSTNERFDFEVRSKLKAKDEGAKTEAVYKFKGCRVTDYSQAGGTGAPQESLTLAFGGVEMATPGQEALAPSTGSAGTLKAAALGGGREVNLHAASWGGTSPTDPKTGQAEGRAAWQQVAVTKDIDDLSPTLLSAMTENRQLGKVTLTLGTKAASGVPTSAGTLELDNTFVSGVSQGSGKGRPTESVSLRYGGFSMTEDKSSAAKVDAPSHADIVEPKQGNFSTPVLTWSWSEASPRDASTGQARGRAHHTPFVLTVPGGAANARFVNALNTNAELKTVTIHTKTGPGYVLTHARVTGVQMATGDNSAPVMSVTIEFQEITETAGKVEATIKSGASA